MNSCDIEGIVKKKPPYECLVGDYSYQEGRIPDEFLIRVTCPSETPEKTIFELAEWYLEGFDEHKLRKKQVEEDRKTILQECRSARCSYDIKKNSSVVEIRQEGTREEITLAIFREISVHAKYFLGEDKAEYIFENLLVEGKDNE